MDKIRAFMNKHLTRVTILLLIPILTIINFSHHSWVKPESVIAWDVKSYYAYLPATIIHKDISLDFMEGNSNEYSKWIWPIKTQKGKRCIVTSMGLSILYSPFFLIGHTIAKLTPFEANGYTEPYAMALVFSAMLYVLLGFWYLRKLLLKYFDELTVFLTIIVVLIGTNLLYYTSWSAPMPHSYSFGLISIFIYWVDKWHEEITFKKTIYLGLLSGLIALIRPTNILVLIILFLWNTKSLKDIGLRINLFIKNYKQVLLMVFMFFLVWVPQFIYWKYVSGKFLYFSYGDLGATFIWNNPQFTEILLSFRKGWWIYTPIMFVSTIGIFLMFKKLPKTALSVLVFLLANIYVQASWWCWWFGGSFGLRAFIDSYGIMAIPLATVIHTAKSKGLKGTPVFLLIALLTWYATFQTKQFNRMAIHWWWMSKTSYSRTFLKTSTPPDYWAAVPIPDYKKAREGVYVSENLIDRKLGYGNIEIEPRAIMEGIKENITVRAKHHKMAERLNISVDSVLTIEAFNRYEKKWSVDKYVRPLIISEIVDSIKKDSLYLNDNILNWESLPQDELDELLYEQTAEELKKTKFE